MAERKIEVRDYDPNWQTIFEIEQQRLKNVLGGNALYIEHIGSTSVQGLVAKPIIDILIEVADIQQVDEHTAQMEQLGYRAKMENGIAGRRYFQKGALSRTHHVHCFETGDDNLLRHRAFKHYLIAHSDVASQYAEIKKHAALNCSNVGSVYQDMKSEFISKHEALALEWAEQSTK